MFFGTPPFGFTGFMALSGGVLSNATAFPTSGADTEAVVNSWASPDALATSAATARTAAAGLTATNVLRMSSLLLPPLAGGDITPGGRIPGRPAAGVSQSACESSLPPSSARKA
jgi:hypothetical protein